MGLNISKGNMYSFVTHTWNTIKGACHHDCSYCYMKRWGKLNPVRFDEKELKTDLGKGNFIFVGSSCDMFAADIPKEWIEKTLECCLKSENRFLFQTKNPEKLYSIFHENLDWYEKLDSGDVIICTTIETNRYLPEIMGKSPIPSARAEEMAYLSIYGFRTHITIEPIMDFDLDLMVQMIYGCQPEQVNIGADSGKNELPEPLPEKVKILIEEISKFTKVHQKETLKRIYPGKKK